MTLILKMKRINFKQTVLFFCLSLFLGCQTPKIEKPLIKESPTQESLKDKKAPRKALKIVQACEKAFEEIQEYTSVYLKVERSDSGKLRKEETILVKYRKPNQIYMKWIKEPNKGMELIYPVREDKLLVEAGGIVDVFTPKLYLNPRDKLAMLNNRHPVTEADIGFFINRYANDFKKALKKNEAGVVIKNPSSILNRQVTRVEVHLSGEGYYCERSVVYFDNENHFPLHVEFYDGQDELFERYSFTQLDLKPHLKDIDFDEENPEYDF